MASPPRDHEKVQELQASLRQALDQWDNTDEEQRPRTFAHLVPAVNDLVAAQQENLRRRAAKHTAELRRTSGWSLLAAVVVGLVVLLVTGWNAWWLVLLVPAVLTAVYLLTLAGTDD
jgi:Flp pilus assembly protein TadB